MYYTIKAGIFQPDLTGLGKTEIFFKKVVYEPGKVCYNVNNKTYRRVKLNYD